MLINMTEPNFPLLGEEYSVDTDQLDIDQLIHTGKPNDEFFDVFMYDRDDGEYYTVTKEEYIKMLQDLRERIDKKLSALNEDNRSD